MSDLVLVASGGELVSRITPEQALAEVITARESFRDAERMVRRDRNILRDSEDEMLVAKNALRVAILDLLRALEVE